MFRVPSCIRKHWWLSWILLFVWPIWWAFDYEAPYEVLPPVAVSAGIPGGYAYIDASVRRDLSRDCSVTFTRYLISPQGFRVDFDTGPLGGPRKMSAEAIQKMDADMGGRLQLALPIPSNFSPGTAIYGAELDYVCNPLQYIVPIHVSSRIPITIVGAKP